MCWKGVSFGLLVPLCGIVAPFGPEPTGGGSPERLWTRNRAGALPAEALRCKLPVGRETKMEILAYNVNDGSNRDLPIRAARSVNMYPEEIVRPMREELTSIGFREMRTPQEVDALLANANGTALVVVNSICGCAAGKARPGVALALSHRVRPDILATVFAGNDLEAAARARSYF